MNPKVRGHLILPTLFFFCHAEMLMRLKKVVPLITYCATHCKVNKTRNPSSLKARVWIFLNHLNLFESIEPIWILLNPFESIWIFLNLFESFWIYLNLFESFESIWIDWIYLNRLNLFELKWFLLKKEICRSAVSFARA